MLNANAPEEVGTPATIDQWLLKVNQKSGDGYEVVNDNVVAQNIVRIISELPKLSPQEQYSNLVMLSDISAILSQSPVKYDVIDVFSQGMYMQY